MFVCSFVLINGPMKQNDGLPYLKTDLDLNTSFITYSLWDCGQVLSSLWFQFSYLFVTEIIIFVTEKNKKAYRKLQSCWGRKRGDRDFEDGKDQMGGEISWQMCLEGDDLAK